MERQNKTRPRVPSGSTFPSKGSSMGSHGFRGAKNVWELSSCPKPNRKMTKLAVAWYNARTLRTDDRLEELLCELDRNTWSVIGLSEVQDLGKLSLDCTTAILYNRGKEDLHEHGVAVIYIK
ncbi:jg19917 [Pararge aegeria aegeria]|uniref:Jg19917 protein n=1 Tax=Pararge aegeria aegeria TaxID=348720 RepID=A0A8S4SBP3_9NEOP|nr:jg19917 [Pararge aegeria aegeria]